MYGAPEHREGGRREGDFRRRSLSRTRSRSRSPRRRRERDEYDAGIPATAGDVRGRGPGANRPGGEPLSYKAFIAQLPDNVSPQEAEQRYAAYKRERGVQFHRSYWQAHKDDEWLRQQFDPRRLELLLGERNIAARDAALGFDVQAALKHQASAGEPTGEPQSPEKAIQRLAHDVAQAHRLIQTLDAEKGIETAAALLSAVQDCAAQGDQDVGVFRTALHACVSYLWLVHGADYFQGVELSLADYRTRASRSPSAIPSDAGASWEASVDAAWQRRVSSGDPALQSVGKGSAEARVNEFLDKAPLMVADNKFRCAVPNCTKMFMSADFVRKHVQSKHPDELDKCRQQALDDVYMENYCKFAQAADATAAPPPPAQRSREPRQEGGVRQGGDRRGGRRHRDFGPPGGGHPYGRSPPGGFPGFVAPGPQGPYLPMPMARPYVDLDSAVMAAQPARAVVDYGDL